MENIYWVNVPKNAKVTSPEGKCYIYHDDKGKKFLVNWDSQTAKRAQKFLNKLVKRTSAAEQN